MAGTRSNLRAKGNSPGRGKQDVGRACVGGPPFHLGGFFSGHKEYLEYLRLTVGSEDSEVGDLVSVFLQPVCAGLFEPGVEHMAVFELDHARAGPASEPRHF